ncbi:MAG TPA: ATP-grasp domain-containing protein [Gaiellaceae bacterium]|nr:ATP-grasp domain-containing protein [Gaiellaceae bacterium]
MSAVLLTCAGQRVDIVTAFRRAGAETIAADVNPLAPALYAADRHFLAPRIDDTAYIPALAAAVADHDIELIVPLTDLDMTILAENRGKLGALVLLPGAEVAERTNDKYATHLFLLERGIGSPAGWLPEELPADLPYPVLVKARRGFGSRNIFRAENREELDFFLARTPAESFVQEVCAGEEFSIDVFCDLDGRCLNAIPRTMIESKGGESIKGMTIADDELIALGRDVSEALGVVGPATVQCFRAAPGDCKVTDVNLRFGGAFPLPLAAGSEYPALALALARGEHPEPRVGEFREGVVMTRFFSEMTLVDGPGGLTRFDP